MKEPIRFFVAGIAKPAGSKRGFYIKKINRVIITDACAKSKDWKADVRAAAEGVYGGELLDEPIALVLRFFVLRPKSHFRSDGVTVKDSAPSHPTVKPDVLKLARGVEDALTGVIWRDDCLIVRESISKSYHPRPGVEIEIWPCPPAVCQKEPAAREAADQQPALGLGETSATCIGPQTQ